MDVGRDDAGREFAAVSLLGEEERALVAHALRLLHGSPQLLLAMPVWLASGKANLKKQIAERPGAVRITIDEQDLGTVNVYEGPLGIAAQGGLAEFTELGFH